MSQDTEFKFDASTTKSIKVGRLEERAVVLLWIRKQSIKGKNIVDILKSIADGEHAVFSPCDHKSQPVLYGKCTRCGGSPDSTGLYRTPPYRTEGEDYPEDSAISESPFDSREW